MTYKTASGEDVPDLGMRRLLGAVRSGEGQNVLNGIKARVGKVDGRGAHRSWWTAEGAQWIGALPP